MNNSSANRQHISILNYTESPRVINDSIWPQPQYRISSAAHLEEQFGNTSHMPCRAIVLEGKVLNVTSERANQFAEIYLRHKNSSGPRILSAKWLPQRSLSAMEIALLNCVDDLGIDFQSANPNIANLYPSQYSLDDYRAAATALTHAGLGYCLCVSVGVPGETDELLLATLQAAYSIRPPAVRVTRFSYASSRRPRGEREPDRLTSKSRRSRSASVLEMRWQLELARASVAGYNYWTRHSNYRSLKWSLDAYGNPNERAGLDVLGASSITVPTTPNSPTTTV